jgi:hypothetical protein
VATTVTIDGDEQVVRALKAKADRSVKLKPAMEDIADFAERQIRPTHHNRTGHLTRSLYGGGDQLRDIYDTGFNLGTTLFYGRFVFGGTKNMRARPPRINTSAIARNGAQRVREELEQT